MTAAGLLRRRPASDKFRLLVGGLLALGAVYGIADLAISLGRGWPKGFGDSFALWSWGRFLADHPAAAIYDPATLRTAQLALGLDPGASYPFAYPPSFLLLLWPLGQLAGPAACALLLGLSLPLYLWATVGRDWRSPALLAAVAAPTTAIEIAAGQSGFLAAALLAGGIRLLASRPAAAGVLLGLLSYKPQLGLLVPVALVAARQWRAILAASLTALALGAAATMLFGAAVWPAWAAAVPAFSRRFAAESSQIAHLMPTVMAALQQHGVAPAAAQLAQWMAAAGAAAAVWLLFRGGPQVLAGAGLLVASLLATPYAFVYDMPPLATAAIWVVGERRQAGAALGAGEALLLIFAMAAPVTLVAGAVAVPLVPLSLALLLAAIVRLRRRAPPAAAARPARA